MTHYHLGRYAGAAEALERALALGEDPTTRADLLTVRFHGGQASLDEVRAALADATDALITASLSFTLRDHPDPAQRDPELAPGVR